ncbi:helix-turn-helix transcriptional regulator [Clostridium culturomicium]|uniref:helix-turn-helix transcriptional regulator n=1 Tax=Clostridium culturomicium TaxID=1499683 RepID=UPI0038572085
MKLERIMRNWTQEELSKKAGVSRLTISKIENQGIENVQVNILRKIALALDKNVNELFFS